MFLPLKFLFNMLLLFIVLLFLFRERVGAGISGCPVLPALSGLLSWQEDRGHTAHGRDIPVHR